MYRIKLGNRYADAANDARQQMQNNFKNHAFFNSDYLIYRTDSIMAG